MRRLALLAVSAVALMSLVFVPSAQAQQVEERITLSPAVIRPELDVSQNASGKLTIINDGKTGYTFLLYAMPFSVNGEQYDPNYTEINERTEAYQWIQFKQTEFRLEPGEQVEADYTINVPKNAQSGGHYAVLFAETQPPAGNANVARKKRVGSLLYMSVDGEVNKSGSLESWEAKLWQKTKPITSVVRIRNSGNVHFQVDLNAKYKNIFGKKQFELNQQLLILPGTTRKTLVSWQDGPSVGIYKASGSVSYLGKTEELASKYVVFLPIKYVLIFVGVAILLIAGTLFKKRKALRKKISRFGKKK